MAEKANTLKTKMNMNENTAYDKKKIGNYVFLK